METKLSKVRAAYTAGDYQLALRIAAKFQNLGPHRDAILKAHESYAQGAFYAQLGYDLPALRSAGIAALQQRYSLPQPNSVPQQ